MVQQTEVNRRHQLKLLNAVLIVSQRKWVRPQHRTGSLYGGSLQGVDWPMQLFRQWPVLGLRHRARGTST